MIAVLLRTGLKGTSVIELAQNLLYKSGNLARLAGKTPRYLKEFSGIGKDKAATLLAAFEISRRVAFQTRWFSDKKISSPEDAAEIFIPLLQHEPVEKFMVACLNTSNNIINYDVITVGTLNSSVVHSREVFRYAIEQNSANIILIHNHPSGNLNPSDSDKQVTKKLVGAGKIIGIEVIDHIIIAGNRFSSMNEGGFI